MRFIVTFLLRNLKSVRLKLLRNLLGYYCAKVYVQFPPEEWITYQEVLTFGCPQRYLSVVIGTLVEIERLEARVSLSCPCFEPEQFDPAEREELSRLDFDGECPEMFEYRRIDHTPAPSGRHEPFMVSQSVLSY
jgi:hypothetical protein